MSVTTRSMAKRILSEEKEQDEDVSLGSQDTEITEESDGTQDSYEDDEWIVKTETENEKVAESKCMCEECCRMRR